MTPPISIDGTDITGATIDGTDVQEITVDGDTVFTAGVFPTTVTSRPNDDGTFGPSDGFGVAFNPNSDFTAMGIRLSRNTVTSNGIAEIANFDTNTVITTVDLDSIGVGNGDAFTVTHDFNTGVNYGVTLSGGTGGSYGIFRGSVYPISGTDVDLVGRAERSNGFVISTGVNATTFNDIGNPDNVFG